VCLCVRERGSVSVCETERVRERKRNGGREGMCVFGWCE